MRAREGAREERRVVLLGRGSLGMACICVRAGQSAGCAERSRFLLEEVALEGRD